ncbi:MAG: MBL fold metallo-hydrolase [Chitinophagales bacterium]|nr:MBL fold metallo-hydrolase [Chitinophagales bacterium]
MFERFGKLPSGKILEQVKASPNFIKGAFRNREQTPPELEPKSPGKIFLEFATRERDSKPHGQIPTIQTDLKNIQADVPTVVWLGHSSYFIFWQGKVIAVDPLFSSNVSPIYKSVVAFQGTEIYTIQDIPPIDVLIFTHDHYDHLDYYTVGQIHKMTKKIVCPLGVDAHLKFWGVRADKIQTMDWDDTFHIDENIEITALTTRHSSGRTFKRDQSLWCAYFLRLGKYKLFLAGDGGFGKHFQAIGEKYGPFDFGFIENGQYNTSWPVHHMFPEQSAEAAHLLGLKTVVPIHWGKYSLAFHKWNDSIKRFIVAAEKKNLNYCIPKIGQAYRIDEPALREVWWDFE